MSLPAEQQNVLPKPLLVGRIAFVICVIVVLTVSLLPVSVPVPVQTGWDKADHALAFLVLGVLGLYAWPACPGRLLSFLVGFAVVIELLQGMTGYRFAEWSDLIADASGLGFGTAVFFTVRWYRLRRQRKQPAASAPAATEGASCPDTVPTRSTGFSP